MPSPAIAGGQTLISLIDWALAGAVLYVLLRRAGCRSCRSSDLSVAILLGMISHVPGGLGCSRADVLLLKPYLSSAQCCLPSLSTARLLPAS